MRSQTIKIIKVGNPHRKLFRERPVLMGAVRHGDAELEVHVHPCGPLPATCGVTVAVLRDDGFSVVWRGQTLVYPDSDASELARTLLGLEAGDAFSRHPERQAAGRAYLAALAARALGMSPAEGNA